MLLWTDPCRRLGVQRQGGNHPYGSLLHCDGRGAEPADEWCNHLPCRYRWDGLCDGRRDLCGIKWGQPDRRRGNVCHWRCRGNGRRGYSLYLYRNKADRKKCGKCKGTPWPCRICKGNGNQRGGSQLCPAWKRGTGRVIWHSGQLPAAGGEPAGRRGRHSKYQCFGWGTVPGNVRGRRKLRSCPGKNFQRWFPDSLYLRRSNFQWGRHILCKSDGLQCRNRRNHLPEIQ